MGKLATATTAYLRKRYKTVEEAEMKKLTDCLSIFMDPQVTGRMTRPYMIDHISMLATQARKRLHARARSQLRCKINRNIARRELLHRDKKRKKVYRSMMEKRTPPYAM